MPSFEIQHVGIPLVAVKKGQTAFSFEVDLDSPLTDGERINIRALSVNAQMTLLGEDILVKLEVTAKSTFSCDRCDELFKKDITGTVTTLFTTDVLKLEDAEGGEIRLFDIHASELDITQDIVDALYLAIPDKLICNESCKGLCPHCGSNLNETSCTCQDAVIDSRWDALKKLKSNNLDN